MFICVKRFRRRGNMVRAASVICWCLFVGAGRSLAERSIGFWTITKGREESAANIINALVHLGVRRKTARDLCATCQTARRINLGRARAPERRPADASSSLLFTQFGREKEQTRGGWHYFGSALINIWLDGAPAYFIFGSSKYLDACKTKEMEPPAANASVTN